MLHILAAASSIASTPGWAMILLGKLEGLVVALAPDDGSGLTVGWQAGIFCGAVGFDGVWATRQHSHSFTVCLASAHQAAHNSVPRALLRRWFSDGRPRTAPNPTTKNPRLRSSTQSTSRRRTFTNQNCAAQRTPSSSTSDCTQTGLSLGNSCGTMTDGGTADHQSCDIGTDETWTRYDCPFFSCKDGSFWVLQ